MLPLKLFTFLTLCCFYLVQSQTSTVRGIISSQEGPVEYAQVSIPAQKIGTRSDSTGEFILSGLQAGEFLLRVSMPGYRTKESKIMLKPAETLQLSLQLQTLELEEVVISGTLKEVSRSESPVPIEVYSAKFFKANPTPTLFESLQNINGVRPQLNCNICNTGDIHLNGLEGPYTMVLIDGMPIVSGLSTVYGLNGIPQSLIERVEIVKGPASTLYGSEAVGGLINIITRNPDKASTLSADVFSSSWGEVNGDLSFKFKPTKKIQSLLGLNVFNYQSPKDQNADGFTDIALAQRVSLFNKYKFLRKSEKEASLGGRIIYEDRWGGQMNYSKAFRGGDSIYGESIYTKRWELFGAYALDSQEDIRLVLSLNGHHQNSAYGTTLFLAQQYIGFGQLTWQKKLGRHALLNGLTYRYTAYDDNTSATGIQTPNGRLVNTPSRIHLPGIFIQDLWQLNDRNDLLTGIRYDYNSLHGAIFSPRVNYKLSSLNRNTILRISLGNGYRVANIFTEDHAALTGARTVIFTEELKPETSWNLNLNLVRKWNTPKNRYFNLDASVFYTWFGNRIIPDYTTNTNQIIYSNLNGYAISRGGSVSIESVLPNGLKILAGTTIQDIRIYEAGTYWRPLLTEQISGVWSIGYIFPKNGWSIDYTGNIYGPMLLPVLGPLDTRKASAPVWSIQNIQLTKKFRKSWEIYGGLKNLLNFRPPANSIARAHDPFDKQVQWDANGQVIPTPENPQALSFDPNYVFAPNQGIRGFVGLRWSW